MLANCCLFTWEQFEHVLSACIMYYCPMLEMLFCSTLCTPSYPPRNVSEVDYLVDLFIL